VNGHPGEGRTGKGHPGEGRTVEGRTVDGRPVHEARVGAVGDAPAEDARLEDAQLGCAQEPIRVPGSVQPHGVLLAVSEPDLVVAVASANAGELFGDVPGGSFTGVRLDDLLAPDDLAALRAGVAGDLAELNPLRTAVRGREVDVVVHRAAGLLVTEWEPLAGGHEAGQAWHRRLPVVLQRLQAAATVEELAGVLAGDVRRLTGFDRVMVYRFDPEWNGEVLAEDRRPDLEPFLGLRYPASDIPPQARDLYLVNWLRLIPDATYRPVPLVPDRSPRDGQPLDLSGSVLRSVSPVHLEYLANMGVRSSMSVSLVDRGRLWGLIACHHYAGPHRPSYPDRMAAEFLGRTASVLLHGRSSDAGSERLLRVAEREARLGEALARSPRSPLDAVTAGEQTLSDLLPCGGVAVRLDGRLRLLGQTPPEQRLLGLLEPLLAGGTTATDSLVRVQPDAQDVVDTASGVLAVPVRGAVAGDFVAWLRPETLREVEWGGDPRKTEVVEDTFGPRLSPRRSFSRWSETVSGTAAPWEPHEVAAAERLAAHLADLSLRRTAEDSRVATALSRTLLLEKLPEIPGVALAARYAPSARDVVGGDWYDLVLLPGGRVSVVLGDVAGHGISAAATTAQLRHALRAYLLRESGPAAALSRLNELVGYLLPDELATAIVAELDPATGALVVANAGHPPVLWVGDGRARFVDEGRGPALGMVADVAYGQAELVLEQHERLLVYSDGLVELRTEDMQARLDRLRDVVQAGDRDVEAMLDGALAALAPPDDDDVTVLAIGPG